MKPAIVFLIAYLIGSVPVGLWLVLWRKGIDIRETGSGNIGATNVWRAAGPALGLPAFILDAGKGLSAVFLARWLLAAEVFHVLAGLAAIVGNNWSVFLKFRGGRGVSISLGVVIALHWKAALASFGTWVLIALVTRYISVASIVGGLATPCFMSAFKAPFPYQVFAAVIAAFIVFRHRPNLHRLIARKEPRIESLARLVPKYTSEEKPES